MQDIVQYGKAPFGGWVVEAGWSVGRILSGAGHWGWVVDMAEVC